VEFGKKTRQSGGRGPCFHGAVRVITIWKKMNLDIGNVAWNVDVERMKLEWKDGTWGIRRVYGLGVIKSRGVIGELLYKPSCWIRTVEC
jgi:hypothetical protein